ncbi:hypothetical protein CH304_08970 [Rhodococcus sp. 15-649-1-2]|nr:DUF998 domain-containing protein [Rhodococcus sp. 15-649-1-2]OZE83793.1 hypothetical protein CH304_08970 [Rhodococcus sp. 15-649-1-2]
MTLLFVTLLFVTLLFVAQLLLEGVLPRRAAWERPRLYLPVQAVHPDPLVPDRSYRETVIGTLRTAWARGASVGRRCRIAGALFGVAGVQYLLAEAATALRFDGYSPLHDTVSELGVPEVSEWHGLMNASFCVSAASVLAAGLVAAPLLRRGRAQLMRGSVLAYAVGSVLVAVAHTGEGNLHTLGAVLAIGAGNVIALTVGSARTVGSDATRFPRWYSRASVGLGTVGFAASALLLTGIGPVGAVERVSIYTFVAWELMTAATVWRRPGRTGPISADSRIGSEDRAKGPHSS